MNRDEMRNVVMDEEKKEKVLQQKYKSYMHAAKIRYHLFDFTLKEFKEMIKKDCFYCGQPADPFNGIDRIDSSIGYTKYNSVPCCKKCNRMKMDLSIDDFADHILKLSKWANNYLKRDILNQ